MSTIFWEKYRKYTVAKIQQATVEWEPYWHVVLEDTLDPELFELCKQNWPDMGTHKTRKNPTEFNQNRAIYIPEQGTIDFWQEYYLNIMEHTEIQQAVYGLQGLEYAGDRWTTSSLWEDYAGYGVHNHYDGYTMNLAWQVYVYCDGGEHWGTSLTDKNDQEIKRLPFTPNLSWLMRVDEFAWHRCDPIPCNLRQSIMTRYMYKFISESTQ